MRDATLQELTALALHFRDERDWKQFHNAKDVALSMSLEVAEVVELMQWKNGAELQAHLAAKHAELGDELADVLYWVLVLAADQGIDLAKAFEKKLKQNEEKYPVEKSRGVAKKYTDL